MSKFIEAVKPAFEELQKVLKRFRSLDIVELSYEEALKELALIDKAEENVLLKWGESTKDINPTLLSEVKSGKRKYYPALNDYFKSVLY